MALIPKDYTDKLKSSSIFQQLTKGIEEGHLDEIIIGNDPYSLSSKSDYVNQNASMILLYFHAMAEEEIININLLNSALKKVKDSKHNVVLLQDYLYNYLIYAQDNELINMEVQEIWNHIKKSNSFDPKAREQEYLIGQIMDLLPPEKQDYKTTRDSMAHEDALKLFILSMIVKLPKPSTNYTITNFLNYKLDIFNDISPILNELEKEKLINYKNDSYVYKGTKEAKSLLKKSNMRLVFETLQPEESKLAFYNQYTELLK